MNSGHFLLGCRFRQYVFLSYLLLFQSLWFQAAGVLAASPSSQSPGMDYQAYYHALRKARLVKDMDPFVPNKEKEKAAAAANSDPIGQAERALVGAQMGAPQRIEVIYEKIRENHAVLEVIGWFDYKEHADPTELTKRYGAVEMLKEERWKPVSEAWFDTPLEMKVLRDQETSKWCAGAASSDFKSELLSGKLFREEQKFTSALFYPELSTMSIFLYSPKGHSRIVLQFPPSIRAFDQIRFSKPGTGNGGLYVGLETSRKGQPGYIRSLIDNDDPYGIRLRCLPGPGRCGTCSLNLRLPDLPRSYLSGTFTVDVHR